MLNTHTSTADVSASSTTSEQTSPTYVVAIGASAGGLEALEELFEAMPLDTGMAFIVVQHLSPDYKSLMDELLARKTHIPVNTAEDRMAIYANRIYLLPPNKEMIVSNSKLLLTERDAEETLNLPINIFFVSLAETYQEKAVAVILSGSGSDGTRGIKTIHEFGGCVLVQEPQSCKFDGMPNSAINSGYVDIVSTPSQMPRHLQALTAKNEALREKALLIPKTHEQELFGEIISLINERFKLDFAQYKATTIARRIERRINLLNISGLGDYVTYLRANVGELEAAYYDLLIGVTQFFRNPEAFLAFENMLPQLLHTLDLEENEELRIWISGCATGEEAYSIAMVISDYFTRHQMPTAFKILATDIHEKSIKTASAGIYPIEASTSINQRRQEQYLIPVDRDHFQVKPELRQHIVFVRHNVISDVPFTKTHIITCRNLLIYFNQDTQRKVLSLFTFSLRHNGILFLGPSETLGHNANDFQILDSKNKLFKKVRDNSKRNLSSKETALLSLKTPQKMLTRPMVDHSLTVKSKKALNVLLQQFVPPSLLLASNGDILHSFGDIGKYLSINPGEISLNLRSLVNGPARAVVTQLLSHANQQQTEIRTKYVEGFNGCQTADISIRPLDTTRVDSDYFLFSITPSNEEKKPDNQVKNATNKVSSNEQSSIQSEEITRQIGELEDELQYTRENLQATVEELETSNEELQSANEELMAANEELQSTNEELQSVNEELLTVTSEYQAKEEERAQLAADENSIIKISGTGILFLDEQLNVRKFSDRAADMFSLVPGDYSRSINAISGKLAREITPDAKHVLEHGGVIEKEIHIDDGSIYSMRVNRLEQACTDGSEEKTQVRGVILSFNNITKAYLSSQQLIKAEKRFQGMVDAISDGYFEWQTNSNQLYISDTLKFMLGYSIASPVFFTELVHEDYEKELTKIHQLHLEDKLEIPLPMLHKNGNTTWMLCRCHAVDKQGCKVIEGQFINMQRFKDLELELHSQMGKLKQSNNMLEEFAYIVTHDLKAPIRHSLHSLEYLREAQQEKDVHEQQIQIENIDHHLHSLQSLIDDVIHFSKFTTQPRIPTLVDINQIVAKLTPMLKSNLGEKQLEIHTQVLPTLNVDATMMRHLFQNILHNACKYNDKSQVQITIHYEVSDTQAHIIIKDNGIGFDDRFAEDMFKPFKRLVTKAEYEGSGVGLAICKTILEQHGGGIAATSTLGKGSQFTLKFPISLIHMG